MRFSMQGYRKRKTNLDNLESRDYIIASKADKMKKGSDIFGEKKQHVWLLGLGVIQHLSYLVLACSLAFNLSVFHR